MKTIAGLGNPGRRYAGTRHNVGFDVVAKLVETAPVEEKDEEDDLAWWRVRLPVLGVGETSVMVAAPLAFMNLSGPPLQRLLAEHQVDPVEDLLVVVDDLDLEPGRLRMRRSGSSGGHNGLGSIEATLATRDYARLRVGIGRPPEGVPSEQWVLARPALEEEARALRAGIARAADAARAWLAKGVDRAMEEFNRAPPGPGDAPNRDKEQKKEKRE